MKLLYILSLAGFLGLSSCATYVGNEKLEGVTTESVSSQIKKNRTTKSQILALYGEPAAKMTNAEGLEAWGYQRQEIILTGETKRLIILFAKNGRVKDYEFIDAG